MQVEEFKPSLKDFLWRTRGEYWDVEIVCVPNGLYCPNWGGIISRVIPTMPVKGKFESKFGFIYGKCGKKEIANYFVAATFESTRAKDWTNRPIQHSFLMFVPGCSSEEDFRKHMAKLGSNWLEKLEDKYLQSFYDSDLFHLKEDSIRSWREKQAKPFQSYVREKFQKSFSGPFEFDGSGTFSSIDVEDYGKDELLLNYLPEQDYSENTEKLKEEFHKHVNSLLEVIARDISEKFFLVDSDYIAELKERVCRLMNAGIEDELIAELTRIIRKNSKNFIGLCNYAHKKLTGRKPEKITERCLLENISEFLAIHANKKLRELKDEDEGVAWILELFGYGCKDDIAVKELFDRSQILAKEISK